MDLHHFRTQPLLGILRGIGRDDVPPLVDAVCAAGLGALEITMNTAGAPELIRSLTTAARGRLTVGAGTVLDLTALEAALAAGATFVVSPTLVPEVVESCVARAVPVFPGAFSPQEILAAWRAGATMVKVFPAGVLGPSYLREIKGPFQDIELMAVGGVRVETMSAFFGAGASAVAFGASVFRSDWLAGRQYARIEGEVRRLVDACRAASASRRDGPAGGGTDEPARSVMTGRPRAV